MAAYCLTVYLQKAPVGLSRQVRHNEDRVIMKTANGPRWTSTLSGRFLIGIELAPNERSFQGATDI